MGLEGQVSESLGWKEAKTNPCFPFSPFSRLFRSHCHPTRVSQATQGKDHFCCRPLVTERAASFSVGKQFSFYLLFYELLTKQIDVQIRWDPEIAY